MSSGQTWQTTQQLRARARALADAQAGILCRRQLRDHGVPRWLLQLEVRAGRWRRTGPQTVVVHNGPLSDAARRTVAVLETSPRAALDGVTALQHRGITALTDSLLHVIVPRGARARRPPGVVVHESRRFDEADVEVVDGVRVVAAAPASVHAALWAVTDRQATFVLLLAGRSGTSERGRLALLPSSDAASAG